MKRFIQLVVVISICSVCVYCTNKSSQGGSNISLDGKWTYRSLHNYPIDSPFCNLEFATAVMHLKIDSQNSISGLLDMGPGYSLKLNGNAVMSDTTTSFFLQGLGIPNTKTENWEYDYRGLTIKRWKEGINQVDACVGSVIRVKPHGSAKAGKTASFYLVRQ
jgi:hypothetical protein